MECAWTWGGAPARQLWTVNRFIFCCFFKRICFIFPWNNSTYDLNATVGWLESLGYSINARAFGPLTPYLAVGLAGVDLRSARQPLTSHWMSARLYCITTKCSYYNKSSIGVSYTSVQFKWDPFVNKDARSSWVTGTGPMRHKYQPRPMCFP